MLLEPGDIQPSESEAQTNELNCTQEVSGRIKSRRPQPSSGLPAKGFGQVSCIRYGSHPHNKTEEERMRVFTFVRGFLHINKLSWTFFLARLWHLFLAISSVPHCVSDSLTPGEQPWALHTLPGLLTFAVEGPPGSVPGQVLLWGWERIPPKELCELPTSSAHVFPAPAETITGI